MNIKLTITIIILLLIQVGIYFYVHKNEEQINNLIQSDEQVEFSPEPTEKNSITYNLSNGVLNLSNKEIRNLSFVPSFIWEDESIHTVNLNNNQLEKFPYEVMNLPNLERLYINDNLIKEVDLTGIIIRCKNLNHLKMNNNQINFIRGFEKLTNLKYLELAYNRIYSTPNLQIDSLQQLDLQYNQLQYFNLERIHTNLNKLNLDGNYLKTFEVRVTDSSDYKLSSLFLQDNLLKEFPNEVFQLPNLIELQVSNNVITAWNFPTDLRYDKLETFYFEQHLLTSFDFPINRVFPNLKKMIVQGNALSQINIQHDSLINLKIDGNENTAINVNAKNLTTVELPFEYLNQTSKLKLPNLEIVIINHENEGITVEKANEIKLLFPNAGIHYRNNQYEMY